MNEGAAGLLRESAIFPALIADRRLALEVAVIQSLAEALVAKLRSRDPLSERVHATKLEAGAAAISGVVQALLLRLRPGTRLGPTTAR